MVYATRRRAGLLLVGATAWAAIALIVYLISSDGAGNKPAVNIHVRGAKEINKMLQGIPQYGLILGAEAAPVELSEFCDFQSPDCKRYAERILPPIIDRSVRRGEARIAFRSIDVFGPLSASAGAAALAAGEESRGWNYLELFFLNQRKEQPTGANEALLSAIAKAAGVRHMEFWRKRRKQVAFEIGYNTQEARRQGFGKFPVFTIRGPATEGSQTLRSPVSTKALEAAIQNAGKP